MNRSRLLLLLVVLLLFSLWYAWQETPRQQKVANKPIAVKRSTANSLGNNGPPADDAALDFSGGEKLTFKKPKRDLFRPLYQAPVVVIKPVEKPKPAPVVIAPPPPPPKPQPVVMPVAGPKPIPQMNVLGFLHNGAVTTVFLSTRQGDLFLVKEGDRFADGLLVRELKGGKIVISRGQSDAGVTLTIGELKSVRMAIQNVESGRPEVPEYESPEPAIQNPAVGAGQN